MILQANFWLLLLASVVVFWQLPIRMRLGFLGVVSFCYLLTFDPLSITVLAAWSCLFYIVPHGIASGKIRSQFTAWITVAILGYLAYFKYIPPIVAAFGGGDNPYSLIIPIGISYYTFKLIHYAVEVARGNVEDRSVATFLCYIFLFPIFTAGPIERFDHFIDGRESQWSLSTTTEGLIRIAHGLIKKFVFGAAILRVNQSLFGSLPDVLRDLSSLSSTSVWCFLMLVYLYAYMDFAAYSDIAIGASRLFGLNIMENFHFPVLAPNIGDFWKRWHISLAAWCQAYIYLPMIGLTRNAYAGVVATFLIIGLWHGGTLGWVSWGLFHGVGVSIYLTWLRISRQKKWTFHKNAPMYAASVVLTFLYVTASYSFTVIHNQAGYYAGLRLLSKLFHVDLPA